MKRLLLPLLALGLLAGLAVGSARAHFVWLVPDKDGVVQVLFSDNLEPDKAELLTKLAPTKWFVRDEAGKTIPLKWTEVKDRFQLTTEGTGPRLVGGVCAYGVIQRGKSEPFLLNYYAATEVGGKDKPTEETFKAWDVLPLQILPVKGMDRTFVVLWQGKPLAAAEVVVLAPGQEKSPELQTNDAGRFTIPAGPAGLYGVRAKHTEAKAGTHEGKDYKDLRDYATRAFALTDGKSAAADNLKIDATKADPAATQILKDARATRAQWTAFPGFTANVEVNFDGKVHKGTVTVEPNGKVRFEGLDKTVEPWARRTLGSIVGHRIDDSARLDTPCAFLDGEENHPLGRAIRVLNDELHSSHRVKDKQISVVNREMAGRRFTITVQENRLNPEGKYLPASYIVNYWDAKTGDLVRSEGNVQTWVRVDKFDLPTLARVTVAAGKDKAGADGEKEDPYHTRSITLTGHKLTQAASQK